MSTYNKVTLDGTTLMDISDTTIVASDVPTGKVFYGADGNRGTGTSTAIVPAGTKSITENGTGIDVTAFASVDVAVPTGASKNVQVVQGTTRTTSSSMTAIGGEMTVSKTGIYDIYWSAFRSNTSSQYTFATQLYIAGTAYGPESTTWSNHEQNVHLSNVSLTENQKIRVYGRESRGSSYYMYASTLTIVEV